jgi:t-SNARE complex subunit, syntaxin
MRLRHTQSSLSNNNDGNNASSSLPVYTPLDIQRMEEQSGQSQMMQLIPDQNYLRERADAMSAVESNIVELGTIFNKLAVMVNEHSEMVQRVEDNVDDANDNILLSLNTLTDTLDNLRSNRQLFFRLMAVIVIFAIVFITVFA